MPNFKVFDEGYDMLLTKAVHSNKAGFDLIQNCDLPPPMKILSKSPGNTTVISNMMRKNVRSHNEAGNEDVGNSSSIGVMKALRLSQTRAREAEAKYASVTKEMDSLMVALIEDSIKVFGYKQLLRLLEFQVSQLQQRTQCGCCDWEKIAENKVDDDGNNGSNGVIWVMGLAFCFGVAGFGFAIGCKYNLF